MQPADGSAVRDQLGKILMSPAFAKSPRMSRFLRYVLEQTLEGKSDRIKEYVIGVEVFDKDEGYDTQADSTVRTEASKLRARLNRYYEKDGAADPIVITIPKGAYIPVVQDRRQSAGIERPKQTPIPGRLSHSWQKPSLAVRAAWIAAIGCAVLLAVVPLRRLSSTHGVSRQTSATRLPAHSDVPEAQSHYLRARHFDSFGTAASITKAIDEYLLCLTRDSRFAPAYADLSAAYSRLMEVDTQRFRDLPQLATVAALKAVELDPLLAAAHYAVARSRVGAWNWKEAEPAFLLAMKLDPDNTNISSDYAAHYLNMMGRFDESLEILRRGVAINPTSRLLRSAIGGTLLQACRYDEAITAYAESLDLQETPGTLTTLGAALAAQGRYDEAIQRQQRARVLHSADPWILSHLAYTLASSGRTEQAKEHLRGLREMAPDEVAIAVELAGVYSGLGDREQALLWLKRALEVRSQKLRWIKVD